jgi:hypothetical protein
VVSFTGLSSVADRTLYTHRGPIVKKPVPILTGTNLRIISATEIEVPTASFTSSYLDYQLEIIGSPSNRNDGTFSIIEVPESTRLVLEGANFDVSDVDQTTDSIIALANNIKEKYNFHLIQENVHGTDDTTNNVVAADATDLTTAITLINEIKVKFEAHRINVSGTPPVHRNADTENEILAPDANNLFNAVILVNAIRKRYEAHRQERIYHGTDEESQNDLINSITVNKAEVITGVYPGPLTGPFSWILKDPRYGMVADDPTDVQAYVNSLPVTVDAVFGLLGAVVLSAKPGGTDTVTIDYSYLNNPPSRFMRLGTFEFNLNQLGNNGLCGFPQHRYRARSHLIDPSRTPDLISPVIPRKIGWRYKGLERAYTAVLNDPNTLLLNVPSNRIAYPVLVERIPEVTIRYDPTSLPQDATDPWTLEGDGTFSLAAGGNQLTIIDSNIQTGPDSEPPFFTHTIDVRALSFISAAFRAKVDDYEPDGVFTGVGFGLSDGKNVAVAGFIITEAVNLSSGITMANDIRAKFEAHLIYPAAHSPDDTSDYLDVVDASDLTSLVILVNELKSKFNSHLSKGGASGVHKNIDTVNPAVSADATDLTTALALINELRTNFNAHRNEVGVHFSGDGVNVVEEVKQIGILKKDGFAEFAESWGASTTDWSEYVTYRIYRDSDGNIELYLSGGTDPIVSVNVSDLPALSDLGARFDPLQQAFFGSIRREATSNSKWQFIRVNVNPIESDLIEDNKSVNYDASVIPEQDPTAPWITVGHGGFERVLSGNILLLDSTAQAAEDDVAALGLSTGAYRGFLRFEPILSRDTTISIEFDAAVDYYTFGLSNTTAGLFLEDNNLSVQFMFLQFSPSAAGTVGTVTEPFTIISGDQFSFKIGNSATVSIPPPPAGGGFTSAATTAAQVVAEINAAVNDAITNGVITDMTIGFPFASVDGGRIRLTSELLGSNANFEIVGGNALAKLGLSPGTYIGRDSNPEPKVSWFGANRPDLDDPAWSVAGTQSATMLGRTLRLTDTSNADYIVYNLIDPIVTNQAFNSSINWKLDARLTVRSFIAGDSIPTGGPFLNLDFAGALISVDEGSGGKNLELHLAIDPGTNDPYINLVSYDLATDVFSVIAQYAFNWNDGQTHTYNIYTAKASDSILIYGDGVPLASIGAPPTYSGLNNTATFTQSLTFGSGGDAVSGVDMKSSQSVVDWESVAIFRDSKLDDPTAASRRYIGIYRGGDASLLTSYDLHQIDWTSPHTYRIVRDPISAVSVYVDGGNTPVISVAYDVLTLPPATSSFFNDITNDHAIVAFGSFSSEEISRTRWEYIRYSIGRITLTERLVPPHQVLNQGNAVASPDHLYTKIPHYHEGFRVYSGGTPLEEFLADEDAESFTDILEGTPPVPMTQDLESREGLIKVATPIKGIASTDLVNTKGFISNLQDDTTNALETSAVTDTSTALAELIVLVNEIQADYNAHIPITPAVHFIADAVNTSVAAVAVDLATAITLVNELKSVFNAHRVQGSVHLPDDTTNVVLVSDATDLATAVILANDVKEKYEAHRLTGNFHSISDDTNTLVILPVENGALETANVPIALNTVESCTFTVSPGERVRFRSGSSNENAIRTVDVILTPTSFTVTVPFAILDPVPASIDKLLPLASDYASAVLMASHMKEAFANHRENNGGNYHPITSEFPINEDIPGLGICNTNASTVITNSTTRVVRGEVLEFLDGNNSSQQRTVSNVITSTDFTVNSALPATETNRFLKIDTIAATGTASIPTLTNTVENATFRVSPGERVKFIAGPNAYIEKIVNTIISDTSFTVTVAFGATNSNIYDLVKVVAAPQATSYLANLANALKESHEEHRTAAGVHVTNDTEYPITATDAYDLPTSITLLNDIYTVYESHRLLPLDLFPFGGGLGALVHTVVDSANDVTAPDASDPLAQSIDTLNDFREKYLLHVVQRRVHLADDDENVVLADEATDLTTAIALANSAKEEFNDHIDGHINEEQEIHVVDDTVNTVTAADASDLATLAVLAEEIRADYEAHRIEDGVHGSSVFIRLDPPPRVLYEGMKFWEFPTGDEGTYLASISDDETVHLDGINHTGDVTIDYTADALPEDDSAYKAAILANDIKAQYNTHRTEAGVHPTDDVVNIITVADATDLTTAIALVNDIRTQFTAHLIESGVHIVDDDVNTPLDTPATELYTLLALVNELKSRYETHRPNTTYHSVADDVNQVTISNAPAVQDAGWRIITDGPDSPTTALIPGYLRYTAVGSGSTSVCRNDSGIPDTDHRFELTTTLRINSWPAGSNVDTSIYAGFLSSIGPGVAAAIGFDVVNNIPYVKIQDVNSNATMYRVPFDWTDGNFHTYKMVRDVVTDSIKLVIVS